MAYRNVTMEQRIGLDNESESAKTSTSGGGEQMEHELFTKYYLWDALAQHLSTPHGTDLVSNVKTREELVHGLKKLGCWPLKGLSEKDLHQLVALLVSEKKWVEESLAKYFLFNLPSPTKEHVFHQTPLFAWKHGRELDHQKLGYPDLESLLQIMPGVRIKFPSVLAAENAKGQARNKDNGNQSNGDDFVWEEPGPISGTSQTPEGIDKELCYHLPLFQVMNTLMMIIRQANNPEKMQIRALFFRLLIRGKIARMVLLPKNPMLLMALWTALEATRVIPAIWSQEMHKSLQHHHVNSILLCYTRKKMKGR